MRHSLKHAYFLAKTHLTNAGYGDEIVWQKRRSTAGLTESELLREAAWVILNGGMRERVVRGLFPAVSAAFFDWRSAVLIRERRKLCRGRALSHFRHSGKIDAIIAFADEVAASGHAEVVEKIRTRGREYLMAFPFLGPATSLHLMKNLGFEVAKPDRHLVRIARAAGRSSPEALCREISFGVGDPISVVDIVLWRFATLRKDYVACFSDLLGSPEAA